MSNTKVVTNDQATYKVSVDIENKVAHIELSGIVSLKEMVDSFSELIRHPDFEKILSCCYDCSQAMIEVNLNETEIFYHFSAGMREKRGDEYNIAFVCGDQMTQMLVQFYRLFLVRSEIEIEMFPSKQDAVDWLIENQFPSNETPVAPIPLNRT